MPVRPPDTPSPASRRTRPGGSAESYDLARRRGAGYDDYDILVFDSQADHVIAAFPGSTGANRFGAGAVDPRTVLSVLTYDSRFDVPPLELVPTAGRALHRQYGNTCGLTRHNLCRRHGR